MFPKVIKIILAALTLSYGVYQIVDDYIGNGILLISVSRLFSTIGLVTGAYQSSRP